MEILILLVFIAGYSGIVFEHALGINKTATALITGILCWVLLILSTPSNYLLNSEAWAHFLRISELAESTNTVTGTYENFILYSLFEYLAEISQILFFLLGAMTIVELLDSHQSFRYVTDHIRTRQPLVLLWVICWSTFFLSAILDNLTTSIVMLSLARKLVSIRETRMVFAGMVVIAANAGGAWTPVGDITTTMLWIGGQITPLNIIRSLFLPSAVCLLVPLCLLSWRFRGELGHLTDERPLKSTGAIKGALHMLYAGVGVLVSVPVFKTFTGLPPFTGILLGLGLLWVFSDLIHTDLLEHERRQYTVAGALSRIDVPSVLFFLGILMAVGALSSMQLLFRFAGFLDSIFGNLPIIVTLIGVLSAVIDNVPLVAASMGMYTLDAYPPDSFLWEYLAYCAGTGGSMLIIGSAAGVAVMGMEKIDFIWYLKRISWLALAGYAAGAGLFLVLN